MPTILHTNKMSMHKKPHTRSPPGFHRCELAAPPFSDAHRFSNAQGEGREAIEKRFVACCPTPASLLAEPRVSSRGLGCERSHNATVFFCLTSAASLRIKICSILASSARELCNSWRTQRFCMFYTE